MLTARCEECGRTFDLLNPADADEWAYGHDCEDSARMHSLRMRDGGDAIFGRTDDGLEDYHNDV